MTYNNLIYFQIMYFCLTTKKLYLDYDCIIGKKVLGVTELIAPKSYQYTNKSYNFVSYHIYFIYMTQITSLNSNLLKAVSNNEVIL